MKRSRILRLALLGVLLPTSALSQEVDREALCRKYVCRPATMVRLRVSATHGQEFPFPKGPYVTEEGINILSGEAFAVTFGAGPPSLLTAGFAKALSKKASGLELSLKYDEEAGTILTVRNATTARIKYDCLIQYAGRAGFRRTSTLGIDPGLEGYENWREPVVQIAIVGISVEKAR